MSGVVGKLDGQWLVKNVDVCADIFYKQRRNEFFNKIVVEYTSFIQDLIDIDTNIIYRWIYDLIDFKDRIFDDIVFYVFENVCDWVED